MMNINTEGKIKNDTTLAIASDLHIDENFKNQEINNIIKLIEKENPNYILILGDILQQTNINSEDLRKVSYVLKSLTNIAPTYSIYGNHDVMAKYGNIRTENINQEYNELLLDIKGLTVLNNKSIVLDENIVLTGANFSFSYYLNENSIDYLALIKEYAEKGLFNGIDSKSYNIFLQHSPNNIFNKEIYLQVLEIIKETYKSEINLDLILAGHEHNGLVPNYISKIIKGNRGIIGELGRKKTILYNNCRNNKQINDNTLGVIVPPVTTFTGGLRHLNKLYPQDIKTLTLKK